MRNQIYLNTFFSIILVELSYPECLRYRCCFLLGLLVTFFIYIRYDLYIPYYSLNNPHYYHDHCTKFAYVNQIKKSFFNKFQSFPVYELVFL